MMSDSPSKAKYLKSKTRVADQPPLPVQSWKRAKNQEDEKKDKMLLSITCLSI